MQYFICINGRQPHSSAASLLLSVVFFNYHLWYKENKGGHIMLTKEQFETIQGLGLDEFRHPIEFYKKE